MKKHETRIYKHVKHFNSDRSVSKHDVVKYESITRVDNASRSFGEKFGSSFPLSSFFNFPTFLVIFLLIILLPAFTLYTSNPSSYSSAQPVDDFAEFVDYGEMLGVPVLNISTYSEEEFFEDYHGISWNDYAASQGIEILSLTNLIRNGQFITDLNSDGLANYWYKAPVSSVPSLINGQQRITSFGGHSGELDLFYILANPFPVGNYYVSVGDFSGSVSSPFLVLFYLNDTNENSSIYSSFTTIPSSVSSIVSISSSESTGLLQFSFYKTGSNYSNTDYIQADNISFFNSSTYTKTQIDTALAHYGYLDYNVTYNLVDVSDPNYQAVYDAYWISGLFDQYLAEYGATSTGVELEVLDLNHKLFNAYRLGDELDVYNSSGDFDLVNYYDTNLYAFRDLGLPVVNGFVNLLGPNSLLIRTTTYLSMFWNYTLGALLIGFDQGMVDDAISDTVDFNAGNSYEDWNSDGVINWWESFLQSFANMNIYD